MIEDFFSRNFRKSAETPVLPKIKIAHPAIREIYETYGICTSEDGFYRIIDPEDWQESYMPWFLLMRDEEEIFKGTELYPFMTTAFGHAYIFANLADEDFVGYIDVTNNYFAVSDAEFYLSENLNDPMFYRYSLNGDIYEQLSPVKPLLKPSECFGFFPLLSLGGDQMAENVKRVMLREHLDILAQASGLPEA